MASHGAEVRAAAMPATVLRQHQRCNSAVCVLEGQFSDRTEPLDSSHPGGQAE